MKTYQTFSQVLNSPESRRLVDAIEDTLSSLRDYPNGDATLEEIVVAQISELRSMTGYEYIR